MKERRESQKIILCSINGVRGAILLHTITHLHTLIQALNVYVHVHMPSRTAPYCNVPTVKESAADRVNRSFCITSSRVLTVQCYVI